MDPGMVRQTSRESTPKRANTGQSPTPTAQHQAHQGRRPSHPRASSDGDSEAKPSTTRHKKSRPSRRSRPDPRRSSSSEQQAHHGLRPSPRRASSDSEAKPSTTRHREPGPNHGRRPDHRRSSSNERHDAETRAATESRATTSPSSHEQSDSPRTGAQSGSAHPSGSGPSHA